VKPASLQSAARHGSPTSLSTDDGRLQGLIDLRSSISRSSTTDCASAVYVASTVDKLLGLCGSQGQRRRTWLCAALDYARRNMHARLILSHCSAA